jgi:ribosomal-protein-alanine N-acetyltransferase
MSMEVPRLVTDRLVVTLPAVADAARVAEYWRRNDQRFAPISPPRPEGWQTKEHWETRLAKNLREHEDGTSLRMMAFLRDDPDGEVIAQLSFSQMFRGPFLSCTLGYGIDGRFEGRGLMREGLVAAIGHVFDTLGFHRIAANHLPDNLRSAQLLRRLGFEVEGYAREYLFIDGAWRDHVLTALIAKSGARAPETQNLR